VFFWGSSAARAQTDLAITQQFDNTAPGIGDVVTITLNARNSGTTAATGVTVNDLLPVGYAFLSVSSGTGYNNNTGIWAINSLPGNGSATLSIQVRVTNSDSYVNIANISGNEIETVLINNVSTASIQPVYSIHGNVFYDANGLTDGITNSSSAKPLFSPAHVSLTNGSNIIFTSPDIAGNGRFSFANVPSGSYQLVLHNNPLGSLTPTLPADWVNTSEGFDGGSVSPTDGTLFFQTNTVNPSKIVFTEDFGPGIGPGPALEAGVTNYNYAGSSSSVLDGQYAIISDASQSYWSWQKIGDHTSPNVEDGRFLAVNASIEPNEFYRKKVTGLLANQAYQLSFWAINVIGKEDYLGCSDKGFVFPNIKYSISGSSGGTMLRSGVTGVIAYAEKAEWIQYTFDFNTGNATEVDFVLSNIAAGGCGNDLGIDDISIREIPSISISSVSADFGVKETPASPFLKFEKVVTGKVPDQVGEILHYNLTVTNVGEDPLTNISITDDHAEILNPRIASLPVNKPVTVTARHVLTQEDIEAGKVTNQARAEWKDPDGSERITMSDDPATTLLDDPTVVPIAQAGAITLVKTGSANKNGNTIDYTFRMTNTGNVPLKDFVLTDPLLGGVIEAGFLTLGPGQSGEIKRDYTLSAGDREKGSVSNTATVTASTPLGAEVSDISGTTGTDDNPTVVKVIIFPIARNDVGLTNMDKQIEIPVADNDQPSLSALDLSSIIITVQPVNGTSTLGPGGKIIYRPNGGYIGTDSFKYQIKDTEGLLSNEATVQITIAPDLEIPNTFTPNGDGKNDTFKIKGRENYDNIDLSIYNRWGDEVYRNRNYQDEWDGYSLNEGTYYYLLRLKKGSVMQVRRSWVLIKR
jgi:gliding motility-associated-like protein/uncharacterized repeat protein (TIGR01451 family)